jgi:hypothetical protein
MSLSILGTPAAVAATTVTLPTHAAGDIIVLFACRRVAGLPTKPTAGGTVPTWTDIQNPQAASSGASCARCVYTVATASNHTSGTWTNATRIIAVVLRGQDASPIGGNASGNTAQTFGSTAPAVTLADTSGDSVLLHFYHAFNVGTTGWSAAPASYTRQATSQQGATTLFRSEKRHDLRRVDKSAAQQFRFNSKRVRER